jgi:endonuclease/exonuclease/phosphatase family metal-dependent hydrolase
MGDSMGNTRGFLTAVNDKFKVVRVCVVHLCTAKVSQLHPASFLHALRS